MGNSPDSNICFGVEVDNNFLYDNPDGEELWPGKETEDIDELGTYLALRQGRKDPYSTVPDDINSAGYGTYEAWQAEHPEFSKLTDEWYQIKKQCEESAPIEIHGAGTYDGEHWDIVALKGTYFHAYGWTVKKFELQGWMLDEHELQLTAESAVKFCQDNGIIVPDATEWGWIHWATYG